MPQGRPSPATAQFGRQARPARLCNLDRLLDAMEARGLDGLLSYYSRNVTYLGGYASGSTAIYGEANGVGAFVISRHEPDHPIAIMPEFEVGYFLRQPTWVRDIRLYRTLILPFDIPTEPSAVDRFIPQDARDIPWVQRARESFAESLTRACVQALQDVGLDRGRVAFDNLSFAPFVASELPHVQVADGYGLLKFVRMVKTDAELSLLREAHRLNQTAIEHVANAWVPGMSWNDLSMSYYLEAIRLGGFILDRGSMLFFNPRGSESTVRFSTGLEEDFPLEPGMHIMFDCHGRLNNYNWDGGKTWIIDDEPSGLEKKIVRACGDAMGEALNGARPGTKLSQLQAQARRVFERHGVPASDLVLIYFHGVGLDNSEQEWGTPADWAMENGMVVAAHFLYPGDAQHRYFIEEIGVVKPDGIERFFTWDYHTPV